MTPADLLGLTVRPVLDWMGSPYASPEAEVMLLAIAAQETGLLTRRQVNGPARGWWQFEPSGVSDVRLHERTILDADRILTALAIIPQSSGQLCGVLEHNDQLACAFARLLLWTDPHPLPALGDQAGAYQYYDKLWRPGRPRPADWANSYGAALAAVTGDPLSLGETA